MDSLEHPVKFLLLGLLWLILALPLFVGALLCARAMRRRRLNSRSAILAFALLCAFLIAPVPTPIITIFVPNGVALVDGIYYVRLFAANSLFQQLWWWIIPSIVATSIISCFAAWRYFRPIKGFLT
jgi:hypothetical protein